MASNANPSIPTALVGSTGLVGSNILTTLLTHPSVSSVSAFSRSLLTPSDPHARLDAITVDPKSWATSFPTQPQPSIFFSGLGTTRGQAGSLAKQREVDYDLNLALAKAAKDAGVRVYVLISAGAASSSSLFPYTRMKGQLEDAVAELGFEKTVILRPGLIVGPRNHLRAPEYTLQLIARGLRTVSKTYLTDGWAQNADVIARAAVVTGMKALEGAGDVPEGRVWFVNQAAIIKYGESQLK